MKKPKKVLSPAQLRALEYGQDLRQLRGIIANLYNLKSKYNNINSAYTKYGLMHFFNKCTVEINSVYVNYKKLHQILKEGPMTRCTQLLELQIEHERQKREDSKF